MTTNTMTTTAAAAFVNFESQELLSAVGARVALAVLRQQTEANLAKACEAINDAAKAAGAETRRYWLQANGEKVRTTKDLKSHHRRNWQVAGKLIDATKPDSEQGFTALPQSLELADIQQWVDDNEIGGMTVDMLESALGRTPKNPPKNDAPQADAPKQPTATGSADNGSGQAANEADQAGAETMALEQHGTMLAAISQQLANALTIGGNMPAKSNKELLALVQHYEDSIREVLAVTQPKG